MRARFRHLADGRVGGRSEAVCRFRPPVGPFRCQGTPVIDTRIGSLYVTEQMSTAPPAPPAPSNPERLASGSGSDGVQPDPTGAGDAGRAAVLAIGDEVLRGEIVNGNAAYLADRLFALGFSPTVHLVVSDDARDILRALESLSATNAVVVSTGGLGPTDDDRTVDVVAGWLGSGREIHGPSLDNMKARFARHVYKLTPNNLRQVEVPSGSTVLPNAAGLAPGFRVEKKGCALFFMPGVPREMRAIFSSCVEPLLHTQLRNIGGAVSATRVWHVYGMGESHIDDKLAGLIDGVQGAVVSLHYRSATPEVHVRVVARAAAGGDAERRLEGLLDDIESELRGRLGSALYGVGEETFPLAVQRAFRARDLTLALAESCTGGYAGQLVTSEPGASAFFLGGCVSYHNSVKTQVLGVRDETLQTAGAVSEATAVQMARGVCQQLGADIGVAITGIAGGKVDAGLDSPSLGSASKPVGTVCFAVVFREETYSETRLLHGGRERIRRSAAFRALALARLAASGALPASEANECTGSDAAPKRL